MEGAEEKEGGRVTFDINERVVDVDGHDEWEWGLVGGGWRLGAFLKGSRGDGSTIPSVVKKATLCHIPILPPVYVPRNLIPLDDLGEEQRAQSSVGKRMIRLDT
jgi:hypothetical protein